MSKLKRLDHCSDHVGQGKLNTLMTKILGGISSVLQTPSDAIKGAIHVCCHWMDTSIAFHILGIRGVKLPADAEIRNKYTSIKADSSLTTRVAAGPAGRAKLFMARGILLRMASSPTHCVPITIRSV